MDRMDQKYELLGWTYPTKLKPSDYFRRNIWVVAEPEERTIGAVMDLLGEERVLWGSDFPHVDSTLGQSTELGATLRVPRSASAAAARASSIPPAKTGQGYGPGRPPSMSRPASRVYEKTTRSPPTSPATQCQRARASGRPERTTNAPPRPTPTSAALTTMGDQIGPTHGTGSRKRRSGVSSDGG